MKFSDNKSTPELIANHRLFDEIAGFEEFFLWYFLWIFLIVIGFILSISLTFLLIPFKVYIKPQAISLSGEDYLLNNRRDAAESVILGVSPMNNFSRERTQSKERRRDLS
ncbi:MAG: hypothetical protein HC815_04290 [Richelia sp. RM1_1_1]|nr:hypothetical protein [Richelia sp. SM1_7_0]NJN07225.1 hypothetical protein [Richelia sp. RM1_1_1]